MFGVGVRLLWCDAQRRTLLCGVGLASLCVHMIGVRYWYHAIGYALMWQIALRQCYEVSIMCVGLLLGVATWAVLLRRVDGVELWWPYWLGAIVVVVRRMAGVGSTVVRWMLSLVLLVAGWEMATGLGSNVTLGVTLFVAVPAMLPRQRMVWMGHQVRMYLDF